MLAEESLQPLEVLVPVVPVRNVGAVGALLPRQLLRAETDRALLVHSAEWTDAMHQPCSGNSPCRSERDGYAHRGGPEASRKAGMAECRNLEPSRLTRAGSNLCAAQRFVPTTLAPVTLGIGSRSRFRRWRRRRRIDVASAQPRRFVSQRGLVSGLNKDLIAWPYWAAIAATNVVAADVVSLPRVAQP